MAEIPRSTLAACAQALESNDAVEFTNETGATLWAIPDVIVAQAIANGAEHEETATISRLDGRKVYIYRG